MKYIKKFENFSKGEQKVMSEFEYSTEDSLLFSNIFKGVLESSGYDLDIFNKVSENVSFSDINESLFDQLKTNFDKISSKANDVSSKGKDIFKKILNSTKDIFNFVKKISSGIKEFFLKIIEEGKKTFSDLFSKNTELKSKIEELSSTKKEGLTVDLKTSRNVIKWYRTEFLDSLMKKSEDSMSGVLSSDVQVTEESSDGNLLSKFIHKIESIPPFSLLHKVSKAGEAGSNQLIKVLSDLTNSLGGPSFQLPVISLLIGILLEQVVKNTTGHWLLDLVGATTPFGVAISGIKMVALFIAFIVSIDAVMGEKLLDSHVEGKH